MSHCSFGRRFTGVTLYMAESGPVVLQGVFEFHGICDGVLLLGPLLDFVLATAVACRSPYAAS